MDRRNVDSGAPCTLTAIAGASAVDSAVTLLVEYPAASYSDTAVVALDAAASIIVQAASLVPHCTGTATGELLLVLQHTLADTAAVHPPVPV